MHIWLSSSYVTGSRCTSYPISLYSSTASVNLGSSVTNCLVHPCFLRCSSFCLPPPHPRLNVLPRPR